MCNDILSAHRFRSELTSPRDVCTWAGFSQDICSSAATNVIEPVEVPDNSTEQSLEENTATEEGEEESKLDPSNGDSAEHRNGTMTLQLTWKDLEAEDVLLSDEVRTTNSFIIVKNTLFF